MPGSTPPHATFAGFCELALEETDGDSDLQPRASLDRVHAFLGADEYVYALRLILCNVTVTAPIQLSPSVTVRALDDAALSRLWQRSARALWACTKCL